MPGNGLHGFQLRQSGHTHCPDPFTDACGIVHLITRRPLCHLNGRHPPTAPGEPDARDRQHLYRRPLRHPAWTELFDLHNPATGAVTCRVRLADEEDAQAAIAAAKRAFPVFSRTAKAERIALLHRMGDAVAARRDELLDAVIEEYGAPASRAGFMVDHPVNAFRETAALLADYPFLRRMGTAEVSMEPLGVAGLITPWNSNAGFICGKLATAMAAGCTAVIKPSEMSARQTQIVTEALHTAGLPPGLVNIVTGRGDRVGRRSPAMRTSPRSPSPAPPPPARRSCARQPTR